MNKILLDKVISYDKEGSYNLSLTDNSIINLNSGNIKLYIVAQKEVQIEINVRSDVDVYFLSINSSNITINLLENGKINFSLIGASIDSKVEDVVSVNHKARETVSNITLKGISNNYLKFVVNGVVEKGSVLSSCNQVNRIVNVNSGLSAILPNLYIDEFDAGAYHSAYTGPFKEKDLFYLECKGIKREDAYSLLLEGFLKSDNLPYEFNHLVDDILKKIMRR